MFHAHAHAQHTHPPPSPSHPTHTDTVYLLVVVQRLLGTGSGRCGWGTYLDTVGVATVELLNMEPVFISSPHLVRGLGGWGGLDEDILRVHYSVYVLLLLPLLRSARQPS